VTDTIMIFIKPIENQLLTGGFEYFSKDKGCLLSITQLFLIQLKGGHCI
jgi:hypothetical protein